MIELFEKGETCMLLVRYKNDIDAGYLQTWWTSKIFTVNDGDGIIQNFISEKCQKKILLNGLEFSIQKLLEK